MSEQQRLPHYRVVYEAIRDQIEQGLYKAGELLPSENELSRQFKVARPTVRNALDRLVIDGFILKQQGKGSIVTGKPKGVGILSLKSTTSAVGEDLITQIIVKPVWRPWKEAFVIKYLIQNGMPAAFILNDSVWSMAGLSFLILLCCPILICLVSPCEIWKMPLCFTY
jgi:DNA-binding transcriptional regulator YhcF (GntR family)